MTNKSDEQIINEYEELIVLLKQLHKDTPVLENQHKSIKQAFVEAQNKLEQTSANSQEELLKAKEKIKADFNNECQNIISANIKDAQAQTDRLLYQLKNEKKGIETLLAQLESKKNEINQLLINQSNNQATSKKATNPSQSTNINPNTPAPVKRTRRARLVDGEQYSGEELAQKFQSHIGFDLFVKRIIPSSSQPWDGDYCMFVTSISDSMVCGEIYKDSKLKYDNKSYPLSDTFAIYRGPNEEDIKFNRLFG